MTDRRAISSYFPANAATDPGTEFALISHACLT
jgi:hypothetical protein